MARINIEEEAWPRIYKAAEILKIRAQFVAGHLTCMWHESQDILKTHGTREEILDWLGILDSECDSSHDRWLGALVRTRFISSDDGNQSFKIHGNETQINNRVAKMSTSAKGGEATKRKWATIQAQRQAQAEGAPPDTPDGPDERAEGRPDGLPPAGRDQAETRHNSMQCNSMQFNAIQEIKPPVSDSAKLEARMKFDFPALFAKYPNQRRPRESLALMAEKIHEQEVYDEWAKAIANYAKHCELEEIKHKFTLQFPNFADEWEYWRDWSPPADAENQPKDDAYYARMAEKLNAELKATRRSG